MRRGCWKEGEVSTGHIVCIGFVVRFRIGFEVMFCIAPDVMFFISFLVWPN